MIKILYFAKYREAAGRAGDELNIQQPLTMAQLIEQVKSLHDETFLTAISQDQMLTALNQEMVESDVLVHPGDEVAIFPPVTGG